MLERCLYFKDYRNDSVQRKVSEEVFDLWIKFNVCPISVLGIKNRLSTHIKDFYKLVYYDKKKKGPKFEIDAANFIEESNKLFDIYQKDQKKLAETEKN